MELELFRFDKLSIFIGGFIALFTALIFIYSVGWNKKRRAPAGYYLYFFLTFICSLGAVFADNLILFITLWGFIGFLLYRLIGCGVAEYKDAAAKKALIIIGGSDALMILGIAILWISAGTFNMSGIRINLDSGLAVAAFLCLLSGAFAKAGAMPFHTWIPDTAEEAPIPVTAYLPASLDKLLGIYLTFRMCTEIFIMNKSMNFVLMLAGSITIIGAVLMALIQHNFKRLLGYHAVSQVGYMVIGIGTANPVGMAGGLFHMLNHAIYKASLFLSGGAVEKNTGTSDLDDLGGAAKYMPITFIIFLIGSFAISGIPPFNGFASKWMIYQGIIDAGKAGDKCWIIWLVAAMFGSALTLASFMKLVYSIFLGDAPEKTAKSLAEKKESSVFLWLPGAVLAALCVIFGVFAYRIPLKLFIFPSVGSETGQLGIWDSSLATTLLLSGIFIGIILYVLFAKSNVRVVQDEFVGGEDKKSFPGMKTSGADFYNSISEIGIFKWLFRKAEAKVFDIYDLGKGFISGVGRFFSGLHNGILSSYLAWCLLGMLILFYVLFLR